MAVAAPLSTSVSAVMAAAVSNVPAEVIEFYDSSEDDNDPIIL